MMDDFIDTVQPAVT